MFGFAVHSLGDDAAVLGDLFHATRRVIIYLVSIVIWFSPIGILSLISVALAGLLCAFCTDNNDFYVQKLLI